MGNNAFFNVVCAISDSSRGTSVGQISDVVYGWRQKGRGEVAVFDGGVAALVDGGIVCSDAVDLVQLMVNAC